MATFYKGFYLLFFVFQMRIQFSTSTYGIYRGIADRFSRNIVDQVPASSICRTNEFCSCGNFETFTYDGGQRLGECVNNDQFVRNSGCSPFRRNSWISTVRSHTSAPLQLSFTALGRCELKSTEYTEDGDYTNWLQTGSNPRDISVFFSFPSSTNILQISDVTALFSTFSGTLLKIQVKCTTFRFGAEISDEKCLLLKIEGQRNITTLPSNTPTTTSPTTTSSTLSVMSPTTSASTSSNASVLSDTSSPATKLPEIPVNSPTEDLKRNTTFITTKVATLPSLTTTIQPDPRNREREGGESDSSSLVPILVPTLLSLVLLIVLIGVLLHRKRQRSMSANIEKGVEEIPSPQHGSLAKKPPGPSYAIPESQINTTPIYDAVYENTNASREDMSNPYEFEYDYTTCDGPAPRSSDNSPNNPSTDIYQDIDSDTKSTESNKDNLGYDDEDPYYHSLEEGNVYDRVTEEPQSSAPFYDVLEKSM